MGCSNNTNKQQEKKQGPLNIKEKNKEKQNAKEYEIKICLLGDVSVGKTSIASRFCKNSFNENYINTIGGAYQQQNIILNNGVKMKLHIWDTSGQDRFRSMTNLYYRDAQVAILTYDVGNEQSLDSLTYWLKELNDKVDQDNMLLCLAGNKNDIEASKKRVSTAKGKEFAEQHNMIFYETSAKTGAGVKELFQAIATKEYEIINENK
jgi:Ras-related protein Rab-5C